MDFNNTNALNNKYMLHENINTSESTTQTIDPKKLSSQIPNGIIKESPPTDVSRKQRFSKCLLLDYNEILEAENEPLVIDDDMRKSIFQDSVDLEKLNLSEDEVHNSFIDYAQENSCNFKQNEEKLPEEIHNSSSTKIAFINKSKSSQDVDVNFKTPYKVKLSFKPPSNFTSQQGEVFDNGQISSSDANILNSDLHMNTPIKIDNSNVSTIKKNLESDKICKKHIQINLAENETKPTNTEYTPVRCENINTKFRTPYGISYKTPSRLKAIAETPKEPLVTPKPSGNTCKLFRNCNSEISQRSSGHTFLKTPDSRNVPIGDNSTPSVIQSNKENEASITKTDNVCTYNLKTINIKGTNYIILDNLGIGGTAQVYSCYEPVTKRETAVKVINLEANAVSDDVMNEIKILKRLNRSDRIIRLYDYELTNDKKLLIVLEKGGKDLAKIFKEYFINNDHLPVYLIMYYWMEMLHAVKEVHAKGIIHADLKPANFLKCSSGIKLIDFGIAIKTETKSLSVRNNQVGSPNYVSPEALINNPSNNCDSPNFGKQKYQISFKSDVWSLGCILYQMIYKKTPFQHIVKLDAKLLTITNSEHKIPYPELDWLPQKIIDTTKKCLTYNMLLRPSVSELIRNYEANV